MEENKIEENKIEMTEDIEYFLLKAKSAIEQAVETRDPMVSLSPIRQAEITLRSHINYLQAKSETLSS